MKPLQCKARRFLGATAAIALGTTSLIVISGGPAAASGPGCSGATIEVTANTDAALRAAFATASGLAGPQTICIDSGLGTVTLSGGELVYNAITTAALTLQGNGIIVNGNDASRVMNVSGSLTLDNVTVTGGHASDGFGAGGVVVNGNATLTNSTISDNTSTNVGAVGGMFVNGGLTLTGSTISGNTETAASSQGGVYANGNVSLTNSTISGNSAANDGGLYANGRVTLLNSTVSGNTGTAAGGGAGAIHANGLAAVESTISGNSAVDHGAMVSNGDVTLVNSTVSGNTATGVAGSGGGMYVSGKVTLVYATVDGNHAAVGANVDASSALTSFGSVVAEGQGGGANCVVGSTTSYGYNSTDDASGAVSCHFAAGTDLVGSANDPMLAAVADNGGPTLTQLPLPLSPLVGAIPSASCETDGAIGITIDQRGLPRPAEGSCDIGAVEVQAPPPTTTTTTTTSSSSTTPPSTMLQAQAPTPVVATPRLTG